MIDRDSPRDDKVSHLTRIVETATLPIHREPPRKGGGFAHLHRSRTAQDKQIIGKVSEMYAALNVVTASHGPYSSR